MPKPLARSATSWPMRPKPEHAERLLVHLDAAELRALPAPLDERAVRLRDVARQRRASARSCARRRRRCSTSARWPPRCRAGWRPATSTLSTPMPARPMTLRRSARSIRSRGQLGGRADDDAVVAADALGQLAVLPVDRRGRPRSARGGARPRLGDLLLDEDPGRVASRGRAGGHAGLEEHALCGGRRRRRARRRAPRSRSVISSAASVVTMSKAPK